MSPGHQNSHGMEHQQWPVPGSGRDSKKKTNKHRTLKVQEIEVGKMKPKTRLTKTRQARHKTIPRTSGGWYNVSVFALYGRILSPPTPLLIPDWGLNRIRCHRKFLCLTRVGLHRCLLLFLAWQFTLVVWKTESKPQSLETS